MKKIRNSLVALTLIVSLGAPAFLGIGVWSFASLASSHPVTAHAVAMKSTRSVAFVKPWCPGLGIAC